MGKSLDQLQYAYRAKRGVADASLTLLDTVALGTLSLQTQMSGFYSWISHPFSIQSTQTHFCTTSTDSKSAHHWLSRLKMSESTVLNPAKLF